MNSIRLGHALVGWVLTMSFSSTLHPVCPLTQGHKALLGPFFPIFNFFFFFKEELALQLINNSQHEPRPYQHSYFRSTIVLILALLMVCAR